MSDVVRAPGEPRTLYFFETLGAGLLACLAFVLGGWLTAAALIVVDSSMLPSPRLSEQTYWNVATWLGAFPSMLAVIWFAVRRAGWQFQDYLALKWPRLGEIVVALVVTFVALQIIGAVRT
jgi:hypothetical protein